MILSARPCDAPRPGLRLRVPPSLPFLPGLAAAAGGGPAERPSPTPRSLLGRRILLSLGAAKVAEQARRLRAHRRPRSRSPPQPRPPPNLGSRSQRTASSTEPVGKGRLRDCGAAWRERGMTGSLRPGCVSERVCVLPVLMVPISLRSGLAADRGRWRGSRMACPRGDRCARWDVHFSDYARGIVCRGTVAGGY